ncbi:Glucose/galactose transporter [Capnocytophaga canimorsus]|uniref:Glucose/galactose transporter n=1 Tax=Capnocytophaga canimorsus TaxID=28188 RepID=A0A0B7HNS5_9FLAO|nr:sugar MFS transporter [Capnocytophaga canimorsus]ATA77387.1 glucose/galactose MFS transporter [Capnocytophaga canimorsus]PJI83438.1 FHS family L-fucose permease-like MFS transporter [Capnocytophaga canimorsus]CEN39143.1 Glucose/galactose transporter [Capnocytophaga canimorsus]STA72639.1 L-fucose permease [Capnocytophaga canimorsus]GIM56226.1 glucose/galactose MFS transporter [Capnocytophaga canimorsus]
MQKNYKSAFIFVTVLFFLWGFITVLVDSLIPRLRDVFTLSYYEAGLIQFSFFIAYFILSIPAGFILSKIGYKRGIILGLFTMALGCLLFYPAASERILFVFMLAIFILAGGITILQVAANPYVSVLGDESGASSRLNLSQAFNSLGTAIAPMVGALFILSDKVLQKSEIEALNEVDRNAYFISEASAVQMPFLSIAAFIVVLAVLFIFIKLPDVIGEGAKSGGYLSLLSKKGLLLGAIGIFLYVGAEVAIGSYLVSYFSEMNLSKNILENDLMRNILGFIFGDKDLSGKDSKAIVGAFVTFYWTGAMVGRFIGAYLTKVMAPSKVLIFFASGAILLILVSVNTDGLLAMWSILAVGLFNSIMFPTIFTLSLDGLNESKPQASGILCTMIVGGAVIPPLCGFFADSLGFKIAFLLLTICYVYIAFFGFYKRKTVTIR